MKWWCLYLTADKGFVLMDFITKRNGLEVPLDFEMPVILKELPAEFGWPKRLIVGYEGTKF